MSKWDFKDQNLREGLNALGFFNEYINERIDGYFSRKRRSGVVTLVTGVDGICVTIPNNYFKNVNYDPSGWSPFPAIKPLVGGSYLVTVKTGNKNYVIVDVWDEASNKWFLHDNHLIVAFKEKPEPYRPN